MGEKGWLRCLPTCHNEFGLASQTMWKLLKYSEQVKHYHYIYILGLFLQKYFNQQMETY